jgi:pyruvate-ferredoxin/flavodoxin oxidoreductase
MKHCQDEIKAAVKADYWKLFSFNPALKAEGKNPFTLSSKPDDGSSRGFLANEARTSTLARKFPERAQKLFAESEAAAQARFDHLQKLVDLYK